MAGGSYDVGERAGVDGVGFVEVCVTDNGPGISADVFPKIFETGFTTKSAQHGTGLGLNIVQRLVKEAGGAIHLYTKAGEGTTFTVYLRATPLAEIPATK